MPETRSKTRRSPPKPASSDSERRNWGNIFSLLVHMVRKQQNQLQSVAMQHRFLEDRLRMQHEAWVSDIRLHNDQISQMKGVLKFEEKKRALDIAQVDLALGYKNKEASIIKWMLDQTEDELADFKAWFESIVCKCSNAEDQGTILKSTSKSSLKIEDELRKLKDECERLSSEKNSEVSALLTEKKFVWNQYNIMEKNYTDKLRDKQAEVEKANEKIAAVISSMEQMQSENNKKDSTIVHLVSKVANMEAETDRLNQEISRLSGELESLRNSRKDQVTPILRRCTEGVKNFDPETSKSGRRNATTKKEKSSTGKKEKSTPDAPVPANLSGKGKSSHKRKEGPVILTSETPKLFSSRFKVPKLKPSVQA